MRGNHINLKFVIVFSLVLHKFYFRIAGTLQFIGNRDGGLRRKFQNEEALGFSNSTTGRTP
jgi:hypothetical protein